MIVTRNWLNRYVNLENKADKEIEQALISLGFEVESVKNFAELNQGLYLGRINVVKRIENSNHLNFCLVDIGKELVSPIVCGANNVEEDAFVVVANPGACIASNQTIGIIKIKDYQSEGMICAYNELGISNKALTIEEQEGVLKLNMDKNKLYKLIGSEDVLSIIGLNDTSFEFDLTVNRSDALAVYEVARELANYFREPLYPYVDKYNEKLVNLNKKINVNLESKHIKGLSSLIVEVEENEENKYNFADQNLLRLSEVVSVNNYQDSTNIVTLETAQPLILIDYDQLKGEVLITDCYEDEQVKKGDLVILNDNKLVNIIGVEVKKDYQVTSHTKNILVLTANIDLTQMRVQQKRYSVNNISMQRYIKPASFGKLNSALSSYTNLLQKNGYLKGCSKINFIKELNHKPTIIKMTISYINSILGLSLNFNQIYDLLANLAFTITSITDDNIEIIVPEWRIDITEKADIAEEVARLYGYNNIEPKPPILQLIAKQERVGEKTFKNIEAYLLSNGFFQTKTYSLVNHQINSLFNIFNYQQKPIRLSQPLSNEHEEMRVSLLKSLIDVAKYNNTRNISNVKLFTIEKIYLDNFETTHLCLIMQNDVIAHKPTNNKLETSFFYLKGILQSILIKHNFDCNKLTYKNMATNDAIHPNYSAWVYYDNKLIATLGKLHPLYIQKNNLKETYFLELDLNFLFEEKRKVTFYHEIFKYSPITRDISFLVNKDFSYETVASKIKNNTKNLVEIELIDVYENVDNNEETVSWTLSLIFNSIDQQLSDKDVEEEMNHIKQNLVNLNLKIRE